MEHSLEKKDLNTGCVFVPTLLSDQHSLCSSQGHRVVLVSRRNENNAHHSKGRFSLTVLELEFTTYPWNSSHWCPFSHEFGESMKGRK